MRIKSDALPLPSSHGGKQITGGVRYIIACFLYIDK